MRQLRRRRSRLPIRRARASFHGPLHLFPVGRRIPNAPLAINKHTRTLCWRRRRASERASQRASDSAGAPQLYKRTCARACVQRTMRARPPQAPLYARRAVAARPLACRRASVESDRRQLRATFGATRNLRLATREPPPPPHWHSHGKRNSVATGSEPSDAAHSSSMGRRKAHNRPPTPTNSIGQLPHSARRRRRRRWSQRAPD